jgi:hypothetical protein
MNKLRYCGLGRIEAGAPGSFALVASVRSPLRKEGTIGPTKEVDEIEVTPAMIEAGRREYDLRWPELADAIDPNTPTEMLEAVYRAMVSVRK